MIPWTEVKKVIWHKAFSVFGMENTFMNIRNSGGVKNIKKAIRHMTFLVFRMKNSFMNRRKMLPRVCPCRILRHYRPSRCWSALKRSKMPYTPLQFTPANPYALSQNAGNRPSCAFSRSTEREACSLSSILRPRSWALLGLKFLFVRSEQTLSRNFVYSANCKASQSCGII